jgi:hypothetical protein
MNRFWDIVRLDIPDAAAAIPKMVIKFAKAAASASPAGFGGYDQDVCDACSNAILDYHG